MNDKQRFQLAAVESPAPSVDPRAVVLVEGISDQVALQALAARRGRDLAAEGIAVVPMGGATNIRRFLERFGSQGLNLRLAGLCDAREEGDFRRGLERAGLGSNLSRADMEALGFYVCVADLEDELVRCLGAARVEQVVEAQGELGSFRTLQQQPAWRARSSQEQLRRFIGTHSGRKVRYARLLVDALELTSVPRPLDRVLAQFPRERSVFVSGALEMPTRGAEPPPSEPRRRGSTHRIMTRRPPRGDPGPGGPPGGR